MTVKTDREIMQQALNDLEALVAYIKGGEPDLFMQVPSIEALRARLAQPEQEPVAWLSTDSIGERYLWFSKPLDNDKAQPLYTAPQKREWQGLTDEDLSVCDEDGVLLARYWESKLKEKND